MHYQEPWTDAEMDKVELQVIDRLKDHLSIETIEGTVLYDWENVSREEPHLVPGSRPRRGRKLGK